MGHNPPGDNRTAFRTLGDQYIIDGFEAQQMFDPGDTPHSYGNKPDETDPLNRLYPGDKAPLPAENPESEYHLQRIRAGIE